MKNRIDKSCATISVQILFWLSLFTCANAQYSSWKTFERINGQNIGEVLSLYQDLEGKIWMSSNVGWLCYDGIAWSKPFPERENLKYLTTGILEDGENWARFDATTNPDFIINQVDAIFEDSRGVIWVANYGNAYEYDENQKKWKRHKKWSFLTPREIYEDKEGILWFV